MEVAGKNADYTELAFCRVDGGWRMYFKAPTYTTLRSITLTPEACKCIEHQMSDVNTNTNCDGCKKDRDGKRGRRSHTCERKRIMGLDPSFRTMTSTISTEEQAALYNEQVVLTAEFLKGSKFLFMGGECAVVESSGTQIVYIDSALDIDAGEKIYRKSSFISSDAKFEQIAKFIKRAIV